MHPQISRASYGPEMKGVLLLYSTHSHHRPKALKEQQMHKETELNIGAMAKEYCKAVVVLLVKFCNLRAYGKFVVLSLVFFFFSPSFHGLRSSCCCVGCVCRSCILSWPVTQQNLVVRFSGGTLKVFLIRKRGQYGTISGFENVLHIEAHFSNIIDIFILLTWVFMK